MTAPLDRQMLGMAAGNNRSGRGGNFRRTETIQYLVESGDHSKKEGREATNPILSPGGPGNPET